MNKRKFIFDKNNEIHRIVVGILVGILEKKYAIGLSKKSMKRDFKKFYKKYKKRNRFNIFFYKLFKEDIEEFIKQIDEKYMIRNFLKMKTLRKCC